MSLYHYKDKLWTLKVPMRESNFELLRSNSPEFTVIIVNREHPHVESHARAVDLINYSIQRNTNALNLRQWEQLQQKTS